MRTPIVIGTAAVLLGLTAYVVFRGIGQNVTTDSGGVTMTIQQMPGNSWSATTTWSDSPNPDVLVNATPIEVDLDPALIQNLRTAPPALSLLGDDGSRASVETWYLRDNQLVLKQVEGLRLARYETLEADWPDGRRQGVRINVSLR